MFRHSISYNGSLSNPERINFLFSVVTATRRFMKKIPNDTLSYRARGNDLSFNLKIESVNIRTALV